MTARDKESTTTGRPLVAQVLLLGLSFVPIIATLLMVRVKWIATIMVYPLYLSFMAIGGWVGYRWHKLVKLDNDTLADPADDPVPGHQLDWVAVTSAVLIGFGIMFFLRALVSHEMARAFDNFMPSHDDD